MIVMPGLAHDQAPNAAAVEEWGAGRALPGDAPAEAIRSAAQEILSTPSHRLKVQQMSASLAGVDGAENAADEVESLLVRSAT
jgi:UDP:flavonoid glycosyltransferase YjiC (YdhE family)